MENSELEHRWEISCVLLNDGIPGPLLCWSLSLYRFFFHLLLEVLLLTGAVWSSGFFGHCFNNTEYGTIFCIMVKGLSVPSIGSLILGFSSSFSNPSACRPPLGLEMRIITLADIWKCIWHCFLSPGRAVSLLVGFPVPGLWSILQTSTQW